MFWLFHAMANIQNVLLPLECRQLRHWSMASSITLCFTPTHTSVRCCLKSFTSCAFMADPLP